MKLTRKHLSNHLECSKQLEHQNSLLKWLLKCFLTFFFKGYEGQGSVARDILDFIKIVRHTHPLPTSTQFCPYALVQQKTKYRIVDFCFMGTPKKHIILRSFSNLISIVYETKMCMGFRWLLQHSHQLGLACSQSILD